MECPLTLLFEQRFPDRLKLVLRARCFKNANRLVFRQVNVRAMATALADMRPRILGTNGAGASDEHVATLQSHAV